MVREKICAILTVMLLLALIAAGCGNQNARVVEQKGDLSTQITEVFKAEHPEKNPDLAKNRKDTLVIGVDTPDGVLNPLYVESSYDVYLCEAIFENLCGRDPQGQPVPGIAEKWNISDDGLEYTFNLRKDVKFSDGTPLTAEDVAFSYYVAADKSFTGYFDVFNLNIKGVKDYRESKTTTIEGIKVVDPYTIKFILDKPNASALIEIAANYGSLIMPKAYYGKDYKPGNTETVKALSRMPVGCGPYKLVEFKEGIEARLVANENYWRGAPKIKNIIFKFTNEKTRIPMLASGEIDMDEVTVSAQNLEQLKAAGFLNVNMHPTNGYGYIGLNVLNPLYADKKVRQALAYGLNRKQVVDAVYEGYADVCNEPQSKVSWAFNSDVNKYEFNPEKAAQLLDEAGWKKGADGIREKNGQKFEIHFSASTPNPVNDVLIPIAKQNYEQLGLKFIPEQMEFNAVRQKVDSHQVEMYFMAWGLTPDPDCTAIFKTKAPQNKLGYTNAKVDELIDKGLATSKIEERKKIYAELYKELNDDLPYIFMYQRRDMWPINCRVEGISVTPNRWFTYDLWHAELK